MFPSDVNKYDIVYNNSKLEYNANQWRNYTKRKEGEC